VAKLPLKSGFLGSKRGYLGAKKMRVGDQSRKAKWCKMQVLFPKNRQNEQREKLEIGVIYPLYGLYFR